MTTRTFPRVLIIIVTWNKKDYVLQLLGSLVELDYPQASRDILVIDNASDDGTAEVLTEQYPDVKLLVNPENLGGTGGFNRGLQWGFDQPSGAYDYYWLLDNDVVVHRNALRELVDLLEGQPDAAVAGSTMMQLDYPYRINEMGAFVDQAKGDLIFNRHHETVPAWKGLAFDRMLAGDGDLSRILEHCPPYLDVSYVAAASLVVRESVARQAGLWKDFFIHFDDVDWCLRIQALGHRILVSSRSVIWHLSAIAKVPTWVLYYDNRNIQYLVREHGQAGPLPARRWTLKKSLYYSLIGKLGIGQLLLQAIDDFDNGRTGKQDVATGLAYKPADEMADQVLSRADVKRILIPWTLDLGGMGWQSRLARTALARPDLSIDYLLPAEGAKRVRQLPRAGVLVMPGSRLRRWLFQLRLRSRYDLVLQWDYRPLPLLSMAGREVLFANYEGCALAPAPKIRDLFDVALAIAKRWGGH